ncbi:maker696 [Drosophila busckii]|uniref:Maker696 n=1 Tax=Drosophila busckii TaxID=30019 RepID=A0A0M4EPA0_DROBS|nr:maker696 [Drosophila busckii]
MFRLQQAQPDPAEEQKRVSSEVRFNFFVFGALVLAIRLCKS